ncbi:MAG: hypothetical protein ACI85I_000039 [Arenicella sp.]|jgi:hypothetical protein
MKKLEVFLIVVCLFSAVLKSYQIIGTNLFAIALFSLAELYGVFSFLLLNDIPLRKVFKKEAYSDTNASRIMLTVFTGFSFAIIINGSFFITEHLPGGKGMLILGSGSLFILTLFFIIPYFKDTSLVFYRKNLIRILFFLFFSIGFLLLTLR